MGKPSGVVRPDGRPARRFGDEIITPGEGYTEHTLGKIRALVADAHDDHQHDDAGLEDEGSALLDKGEPSIPTVQALAQRDESSFAPTREKMCEIPERWSPPAPEISVFAENVLEDAPAYADSVVGYSNEWRKLHIIEGRVGRCVRLTLFSSHGVIPVTVLAIILWPR